MPRRGSPRGAGRFRNQNSGYRGNGKFYDEHDDRMESKGEYSDKYDKYKKDGMGKGRRVSFKPSGGGRGGGRGRFSDIAIRAHLEEDEDMSDSVFHRGGRHSRPNNHMRRSSPVPRGGAGGSSNGPPTGGRRKLLGNHSGWFLITIPHGQKFEKEFIIKTLLDFTLPDIFIPHYYNVEQTAATFYVDDLKMAEMIMNLDRKIQMPNGFKMIIKVRPGVPQVTVNETLKERMKLAMAKRYNSVTKALDLSKFHADPDLADIFCALFRPTIMLAAIDIISENIPDLEALNLNDNKIHLLHHFQNLSTKCPNLKILHMAKNRIAQTSSLDSMKGLPLVELVLDGNPFKDRFTQTAYVSEIRKRFPKLLKLDGEVLPPPIGFDVNDEVNLLTPNSSFLCDTAGADVVRQFLEQYFIIFDSDNRQPLLDAYHENAMISLTSTFSPTNNLRLTSYLPFNRNILRFKDIEAKLRQLKYGRLPVVSFLSQLPPTQHDPQSFAVDLTLYTPQLMLLTVTGIFKEKRNQQQLRSFQRSMVIVPSGSGFCIRNEVIHINNVTPAQSQNAFKTPPSNINQVNAPPSAASSAAPQLQVIAPINNNPDNAAQMQMIQAISQNTNMNLEWSKKCLEETNWDFQRAGYVFSELHKQNKIPPEAFNK